MDWEVRQLDAKTAFLYADIEKDVFVAEPPGFETQGKNGVPFVMKLGKSLYGLAQSPGNWFDTIDPVLISIGFVPLSPTLASTFTTTMESSSSLHYMWTISL